MNTFISQKFKFYSFASMIFLVYVHGYNLNDTYLQSFSTIDEKLTFTTFTEYLFSNGLLRFRIPILFAISGFLYALADYKPYKERTLKRLKTLGLPYLIWGFLAILITYLLELNSVMKDGIKMSYLAAFYPEIMFVHEYKWYHWLIKLIEPIAFQLWFIRVLLIYNISYPFIQKVVEKIPKIWFPIVIFLWLTSFNAFFFEGEGLLFFSLGVWLQKTKFDIENAPKYLNPLIFILIFLFCGFFRTYLAFKGVSLFGEIGNDITMRLLYKIGEVSGFIGIWYGADRFVKWAIQQKIIQKSMSYSFMIYAFHVPILYYLMLSINKSLVSFQYHRFITYIFVPLFVIILAIVFGFCLKKISPKIYAVITGNR